MKMETKYSFKDYRFVSNIAFYEGKELDRDEVIEHLKYWWSELDWNIVCMGLLYREMVTLLKARLTIAEFEYGVQQG